MHKPTNPYSWYRKIKRDNLFVTFLHVFPNESRKAEIVECKHLNFGMNHIPGAGSIT